MIQFKKTWHYFVFITLAFGISLSTSHIISDIISDGSNLVLATILKRYFNGLCGGLIFSVLMFPLYIAKIKPKFLKQHFNIKILSSYFFVPAFCFITTLNIIVMAVNNNPLSIYMIILSYILSIALGFSFWRLLLIGKHKWESSCKRLETIPYISKNVLFMSWLYFAGFIGCVIIGLGFGTFAFIFVRFVCMLRFDLLPFIFEIYSRCLIVGFCAGTIQFVISLYKVKVKRDAIIEKP